MVRVITEKGCYTCKRIDNRKKNWIFAYVFYIHTWFVASQKKGVLSHMYWKQEIGAIFPYVLYIHTNMAVTYGTYRHIWPWRDVLRPLGSTRKGCHICIHVYTCMYIHMYIICIHMYVYSYVPLPPAKGVIYEYTYIYIWIYIHMYTCMAVHSMMYVYTYISSHV